MKSPAFPQTVDSIGFNLIARKTSKENFSQVAARGAKRRESRKNLAILTLVYGLVLAFVIYLFF